MVIVKLEQVGRLLELWVELEPFGARESFKMLHEFYEKFPY